MIQKRLFKKGYAKQLMNIAEGDLDAARVLLAGQTKRLENVFYMAEQAIEKPLKAEICHHGIEVPLTHSLSALLLMLPDSSAPPFGEEIDELTEFATFRRYEEGQLILSKAEAMLAIELATKVSNWARSEVGEE